MKDTNLYINGEAVGAMVNLPTEPRIYFGVTVSRQRAEFLARMLDVPLCSECGREQDECDADPCQGARIIAGEIANCAGCYLSFDPHHLSKNGLCPKCVREWIKT